MNILFVTWDGPQSSYLEGLFLPIFKQLKEAGIQFHILQFTWADKERVVKSETASLEAGCSYEAVSVLRKPVALGSLFTAVAGYRHIRRIMAKHNIDVVLPRSTLPVLSTLLALRGRKTRFVFDADGLPLDERVDFAGQSPSGLVYRLLRDIEAQAVRRADSVLTRSVKAVDILLSRAGAGTREDKFHVVTNGRDTGLFTPGSHDSRSAMRATLGVARDTPLLVYAGSIGPQYCAAEMVRLFELVQEQRSDAQLLVLTGSPDVMHKVMQAKPDLAAHVIIKRVAANEVPAYLACADLGIALRKTSFSMQGVAPIKLGEYLLCGLPVVATKGIGDTYAIDSKAGLLIENMDEAELKTVADWFIGKVLSTRESLREHCRQVGIADFSLEACAASYQRALATVMQD
ncbi:glycosyltransferase [Oceanisphaera sp. IT1-181]|uniref:glycosyltransferase n=1 Tax=Oceanisphaera sp. IT1-181 TaxID=3081199 RepID=UPI0029CA9129|nr:glycosyltransferase [Oceanisphaera sp. IT1-181]